MNKAHTIIVGMPESNGISDVIIQALTNLGFEVVSICFKDSQFHYKNYIQKIQNWYQKKLLGNKQYKNYLKFLPYQKAIEVKIKKYSQFDFALFIRADIYPEYILSLVRSKTKEMIGYQWDGLDRYPTIIKYIHYFDSFFSFYPKDLKYHKGINGITNFFINTTFFHDKHCRSKILFLGSMFQNRVTPLKNIKNYCNKMGLQFDVYYYQERGNSIYEDFNKLENPIPYLDYLKLLSEYSVVVDIAQTMHSGLSFRVFEALGMNKKLITTNKSVVEYEFYHPNNIFLLKENNIEDIEAFLELPHSEIAFSIRSKYSIQNWLKNLLDMDPISEIHLPQKFSE